MDVVLNRHTFLASVTASTVTDWYPVDYRFCGDQVRTIAGTKATNDTLRVEFLLDKEVSGATVFLATAYDSAVNDFSLSITSPVTHIRINKAGSNGAATVKGIV